MARDKRAAPGRTMTTPGGLIRKHPFLTPDLWEALRRASYELNLSESEILRNALREHLAAYLPPRE